MNTSLHREDTSVLPLATAGRVPVPPSTLVERINGRVDGVGGSRGAVESVSCRAGRKKKFSSYPFGENAVPKLLARVRDRIEP